MYTVATTVTSGQECTGPVGSLSHDKDFIANDVTYILTGHGYIVPCRKIVVAWEFCYQTSDATSVTFYPGIWRITGRRGDSTDFALVRSNRITYDPSIRFQTGGVDGCQRVNLSAIDQFTAPERSVLGLYSNFGAHLLHTYSSLSTITHKSVGNQSIVTDAKIDGHVANYNISIRVHLGKTSYVANRSYIKYTACINFS